MRHVESHDGYQGVLFNKYLFYIKTFYFLFDLRKAFDAGYKYDFMRILIFINMNWYFLSPKVNRLVDFNYMKFYLIMFIHYCKEKTTLLFINIEICWCALQDLLKMMNYSGFLCSFLKLTYSKAYTDKCRIKISELGRD